MTWMPAYPADARCEAHRWPALALSIVAGAGCAPPLDWRELRPEGSSAAVTLPCRPSVYARELPLAGTRVTMSLHACAAGGATWAFGHADVHDPARVGPALAELLEAARSNVAAPPGSTQPFGLRGATPNDASRKASFDGRLPDGRVVRCEVAVFAYGTRVYQATAVGERITNDSAEAFFGGLRILP